MTKLKSFKLIFAAGSLFLLDSTIAANDIFGPGSNINLNTFASHGVAVDMDQDGDKDFITDDIRVPGKERIIWYENKGHGRYSLEQVGRKSIGQNAMVANDLDNDGDIDVITNTQWYENNGRFGFMVHPFQEIGVPTSDEAADLFVTDLNLDGNKDLVVLQSPDLVVWYRGDSSQNFLPEVFPTSSRNIREISVVDLDGDGDPDLLTASEQEDTISWHENEAGRFVERLISTTLDGAYSIAGEDIDLDGDIDILVSGRGQELGSEYTLGWFANDGQQNFDLQTIPLDNDQRPYSVRAIDVDGDGDIDAVVLSTRLVSRPFVGGFQESAEYIAVFENDGGQVFSSPFTVKAPFGTLPVLEDIDQDGDQDFLDAEGYVGWYENLGDGNTVRHHISQIPGVFGEIKTADLDADGDMDVVTDGTYIDSENIGFMWYEQIFDGSFYPHSIEVKDRGFPARLRGINLADMDRDGHLDVIGLTDFKLNWFKYNGRRFFEQRHIPTVGLLSVSMTDLDADDDMDLLAVSNDQFDSENLSLFNQILWYENIDQADEFRGHVVAETTTAHQSVKAADLDSDGDIDIVSASPLEDKIVWFENDGGQQFLERIVTDTVTAGPWQIKPHDLDLDGDFDLIATTHDDGGVIWYENMGNASFVPHLIYQDGRSQSELEVEDLDGDGDADLLLSYRFRRSVLWLENDGAQNFVKHTVADVRNPRGISLADTDGDGDKDIVVMVEGEQAIKIQENTSAFRGLAFDPSRNGHGYEFQKRVNNSLLLFYSYDAQGNPEWFFGTGDFHEGVFATPEGGLTRFVYDAGNRRPVSIPDETGQARIEFNVEASDPACAASQFDRSNSKQLSRFEWTIDGESGSWCSELLVFDETSHNPNLSGTWFAGAEDDGWGLSISTQGDLIVSILYFYDANGMGRWLWGTGPFVPGEEVSLEMLQFQGYCRTCEPTDLNGEIAGMLHLVLSQPDNEENESNRASVDVRFLGTDGGTWERTDSLIRLLSDPAR